jgi:hypothetical protein
VKKLFFPIAFLFFAIAPSSLFAQCAPGIPGGGNPSCVPPDVFYNSLPPGAPIPDLGPQWETRWGAVAMGGGGFGAITDMPSKRKAHKAALAQCKKSGGGNQCKVSISYYNQCAAVAAGDNSATGGGYAPITETANKLATEQCQKTGGICRIYYSACSYPVRIR